MTPNEKAKAIIERFEDVDACDEHYGDQNGICSHQARKCAHIEVDGILSALKQIIGDEKHMWSSHQADQISFWEEVRKRIDLV